jgi:predicted acylesterase/phospholipase RssA
MHYPPKRLIFGGAGTRLLCYVGALKALIKSNKFHLKKIKEYVGVSAGSIIAMLISLQLTIDDIETIILHYNFRHMFHGDPFSPEIILEASDTWGLDDGRTFKQEISKFLESHGFSAKLTFEQLHRLTNTTLRILACDIEDAKYYELSHIKTPKVQIIDAVYASCAIPLYFHPARINNKLLVDGGMVHSFPLTYFTYKEINESIGIQLISKISKENPRDSLEYFWRIVGMILNPPVTYKVPKNIYTINVNSFFVDWSMSHQQKIEMIHEGYSQVSRQLKALIPLKKRRHSL